MKCILITYPGSRNVVSAEKNLELLDINGYSTATFQSLDNMNTSPVLEFMSILYEAQTLADLSNKNRLASFIHVLLLRKKVTSKHRFVERAVTAKHIYAILSFLNSDSDWCVILEDDFQIKEDSADSFRTFTGEVLRSNYDLPTWIDICGTGSLNIDGNGVIAFDRICSQFKPNRSNTCCGYMINRKMGSLIVAATLRFPSCQYLAIDWLMNVAFSKHKALGFKEILTLRANNYSLLHGSFLGMTQSWQKTDV